MSHTICAAAAYLVFWQTSVTILPMSNIWISDSCAQRAFWSSHGCEL